MAVIEAEIYNVKTPACTEPKRKFFLTHADQKFLLIALAALFAVRFVAMFWLPFVDSTEARYVEIARKMVETGDWLTPQFEYGVPFWGKPPLHTWLSAFGMKIFGSGAFGARIFIFMTSLGVLGLIYRWVRQHKGPDQALVSITVLASSALFFGASAFVMTDMVMVFGTTLSMIGFYNCITGGPARNLWGRLFFVGIAIGLLAKGPVALVITIIPLVPWLMLGGRWRQLKALPWVSGLLIAAALALPWYIAAELKTPGFLRYFIVGEHYERFVVSGWQGDLYGSGHARPKGMIWLDALTTFLPWTVFGAALLPKMKTLSESVSTDVSGWYSYLAFWSISPLLLFTPAANILAAYALPGLPAAAVLLVSLWADAWGAAGRWSRTAVVTAIAGLLAIFSTVTTLAFFLPNSINLKTERELVAAARKIDPDLRFSYWGGRSYSAEYYTQGRVRFVSAVADLSDLTGNDVRDAVAISSSKADELYPYLGTQFERVGQFGRRVLFVENDHRGEGS